MVAGGFEYTLRVSPRAKNVRFRVSVERGLEVVIPKGFGAARVPALLETRRSWIERALAKTAAHREMHAEQVAAGPPSRLCLPAIGQEWSVEYRPTSAGRVSVRECADQRLAVCGAVDDAQATRAALRRWLIKRARATLVPRLGVLAGSHGFAVDRVSVRWQRSRWGSCSPAGSISLNAQLLFLPPELADHVLLHELCHTRRLDHSREFWSLLERTAPGHAVARRRLSEVGWSHVPSWLRAS